jgi:hypothetical protein
MILLLLLLLLVHEGDNAEDLLVFRACSRESNICSFVKICEFLQYVLADVRILLGIVVVVGGWTTTVATYAKSLERTAVKFNVNAFRCCRTLQGHKGKVRGAPLVFELLLLMGMNNPSSPIIHQPAFSSFFLNKKNGFEANKPLFMNKLRNRVHCSSRRQGVGVKQIIVVFLLLPSLC